jgi:hypothetical protein
VMLNLVTHRYNFHFNLIALRPMRPPAHVPTRTRVVAATISSFFIQLVFREGDGVRTFPEVACALLPSTAPVRVQK